MNTRPAGCGWGVTPSLEAEMFRTTSKSCGEFTILGAVTLMVPYHACGPSAATATGSIAKLTVPGVALEAVPDGVVTLSQFAPGNTDALQLMVDVPVTLNRNEPVVLPAALPACKWNCVPAGFKFIVRFCAISSPTGIFCGSRRRNDGNRCQVITSRQPCRIRRDCDLLRRATGERRRHAANRSPPVRGGDGGYR